VALATISRFARINGWFNAASVADDGSDIIYVARDGAISYILSDSKATSRGASSSSWVSSYKIAGVQRRCAN